MKFDYVKLIVDYVVVTVAKLAGFQAWLAEMILTRLWKNGILPVIQNTIAILQDKKTLDNYENEITKGKESNEQTKIDDQNALLNGKPK